MKTFLLSVLLVFYPLVSIFAQMDKMDSLPKPEIFANSIPCEAANKNFVFDYFINSDTKVSFICDGNSWVEFLPNSSNNSLDDTPTFSTLTKIPIVKITETEIGLNKLNLELAEFNYIYTKSIKHSNQTIEFSGFTVENENSRKLPAFYLVPPKISKDAHRIELSGAFNFGFNNSKARSESLNSNLSGLNRSETNSRELNFGMDLHLGTYVLDPRFIKLSADLSFARDKGAFDNYDTRNGLGRIGFTLDFLPTSCYPFRFKYIKQDTNFLDRFGEITNSQRKVLGFNWQLHKNNLPHLSVNYDQISYNTKYLASSFFQTDGKTLSVAATDTILGWDLSSNYNFQTTDEVVTEIRTRQNYLQFQGRKNLSKEMDVFIGSFYENLKFDSVLTDTEQKIKLLDFHTDLNYRINKKFDTRFSQRFNYNHNSLNSLGLNSTPNSFAGYETTSYFNSFGAQANYRLNSNFSFGTIGNINFIKPTDNKFESATQMFDVGGTFNWNKTFKSFNFNANAMEGIAYAKSNFGTGRNIEFRNFNFGITFGQMDRLLVSGNFNYSYRPDIYQIGGYFSNNNSSISLTTEAIHPFRLHVSIGKDDVSYLTSRGREDLTRNFFSAGLEHRLFSIQVSKNQNDNLRDIFTNSFTIPNDKIFIVLPKDNLIRDPLLRTNGSSSSALFRVQPQKDLTVEVRYIDDKAYFVVTNNIAIKQFDFISYYKLGKFVFSAGYSRQRQLTEGVFLNNRNYFFFRATRLFNIF
ncbi:MAG: hypothetical protein K1X72_14880 [Pyrinomonadaceae bacterium]|nr:hypothetical protein [Pyrinomonadaceae bacterium]